jgi:hypothetical protein
MQKLNMKVDVAIWNIKGIFSISKMCSENPEEPHQFRIHNTAKKRQFYVNCKDLDTRQLKQKPA